MKQEIDIPIKLKVRYSNDREGHGNESLSRQNTFES